MKAKLFALFQKRSAERWTGAGAERVCGGIEEMLRQPPALRDWDPVLR